MDHDVLLVLGMIRAFELRLSQEDTPADIADDAWQAGNEALTRIIRRGERPMGQSEADSIMDAYVSVVAECFLTAGRIDAQTEAERGND